MGHVKNLWRKIVPNPLDVQLKRAAKKNSKRFLITWNRGLGDISLGIYGLIYRIREIIPDAELTFLTRKDLEPGFHLLQNVKVFAVSEWKRGMPFDLEETLAGLNISSHDFDWVFENPDLTWWMRWQLGKLTPRLFWNTDWDGLWKRFGLQENVHYVGVHVQTETQYKYEKNWPLHYWIDLFKGLIQMHNCQVILFGFQPIPPINLEGVIDLRGKTDLFEVLSIVKNRCSFLVVPDSGILSLIYYLDVAFPLKVISLWADPRQGVLKQNVMSPNSQLVHTPLIAKKGNLRNIEIEEVLKCLFQKEGIQC